MHDAVLALSKHNDGSSFFAAVEAAVRALDRSTASVNVRALRCCCFVVAP